MTTINTGEDVINTLDNPLPNAQPPDRHHTILVVGGGTAGITTAARIQKALRKSDIAIIEPAGIHYYQPIWTLVGGGDAAKESSERPMADVIPAGVKWIRDAVKTFYPELNTVATSQGLIISYDYLVVCPGIQIDWDKIDGLQASLGKHGVCCNYSFEHVDYTWECIQSLDGGTALFTQPVGPIKCGGAPQKIMYLASDHWRKTNKLDKTAINFFSPGKVLFGVEKFARTLRAVADRYGIEQHYKHNLVAIRGPEREADFIVTDEEGNESLKTYSYDMIHAVPPMSAPDFIKNSALADEDGWLAVDAYTLQHNRFPNVFGLGDVAGIPASKTGAAIRKQAPVLVENLLAYMKHAALEKPASYNGYSSCPIVTGYGKLVLAEFDYENNPQPSFPFNTAKERKSMYLLKKFGLPWLYWNLMLKGRA